MKFLLCSLIALSASTSFAFVPEYSTIASRAADQHGKGAYLIEQEVTLKREGEPLTVKETWVVNGESQLRLTFEGKGALKGLVQGSIVYDSSQKYFIDPNTQRLMSQRFSEDWLEPLFHFRSGKYLRNRLVSLKITPADALRDRPGLSPEGDVKYEPPPFLRLSRVGGTVAWAIGVPPSPANPNPPALWVEQDEFVVRKVRLPNQTQLKADDYSKFEEGLLFPRQRSYAFNKAHVEVKTVSVKSLGRLKPDDSRFKNNSLIATKDAIKLPEAEALKEFYSRFR